MIPERSLVRASCAPATILVAILVASLGLQDAPIEPVSGAEGGPAVAAARDKAPKRAVDSASSPATKRAAAASPLPTRKALRKGSPFRGLGAWVDLYDFGDLNRRRTLRRMAASGVRTLYIQTGRSNTRRAIDRRAGNWLVAAHRHGLRVVGWYLPYYANMRRDVRRTVAVARYRRHGHRFDGVGVDVEFRGAVLNRGRWMHRVARHAKVIRRRMPNAEIASIVPTPLQMRVAPGHWAGFPWRRVGAKSDAILLMSYWSDRIGCPRVRLHCPYEFTAVNVERTRRLVRDRDVLIHIIGGVGDRINDPQLRAFVRASRSSGADGASIYDVVTTRRAWWRALASLRNLGLRG